MPGERDRLVGAVRDRLHRYACDDHKAVRDTGALKEVGMLLDADRVDLEVARLCGLLLWCRSRHASDDADDLVSALALLEPVWRTDATRVPEEIAGYFAEFGPGPVKATDRWQGPAHALARYA